MSSPWNSATYNRSLPIRTIFWLGSLCPFQQFLSYVRMGHTQLYQYKMSSSMKKCNAYGEAWTHNPEILSVYHWAKELFICLWAVKRYSQQCFILTSVDSDEPVQSPFNFRNSKWCSVSSLTHRIFKQLPKPLISLHVFTGWSESLLVAHTKLLEILCRSSYL